MGFTEDNGRESEWNEASLKSKRLDELQQVMNDLKINPLGKSGGKYNYVLLFKYVDALYSEGRSKYAEKERKKLDLLRLLIEKCLKFMPPHIPTKVQSINEIKEIDLFSKLNFEKVMNLLYDFEAEVKDYNDAHGLTTRNKGSSGLF